jgi:hypothetical protein
MIYITYVNCSTTYNIIIKYKNKKHKRIMFFQLFTEGAIKKCGGIMVAEWAGE